MPAAYKIFLIFKAIITGWTYWFGNRKSLSKDDIDEFEDSGIIIVSFLLYSPVLVPMYIFKGIYYLINGSQKKDSLTSTQQTAHVQTPELLIGRQTLKFQSEKEIECPGCHDKVNLGQKFCTNCGYDLSKKVVITPATDKPIPDTDKSQKSEKVNLFLKTKEGDFLIVYITNHLLGIPLEEAKCILDSAPTYLPGSYERTVALKYIEELKKNGAVAEIR